MARELPAYVKRLAIAAIGGSAMGGIVFAIAHFGQAIAAGEAAIARLQNTPIVGWAVGFLLALPFGEIDIWVKANPAKVTGIVYSFVFYLALYTPWPKRILHFWLWKDRPYFFEGQTTGEVRAALLKSQDDAVSPEAALTVFGGRDKDVAWLKAFAHSEGNLRWASLYGPPGRGKSRLMREWCAQLAVKGWDAALFDAFTNLDELKYWRPRKNTCLVVDEASRHSTEASTVFVRLEKVSRKSRHKIRIVFVDHGPFKPSLSEVQTEGRVDLDGTCHKPVPYYLLVPLSDSVTAAQIVTAVAPDIGVARVQEAILAANGEPLILMLVADMARTDDGPLDRVKALARRADAVIERAARDDMTDALLKACFGAPRSLPSGTSRDRLAPFLPDARSTWDGKTLAAFTPDLIADAILMRAMAGVGHGDIARMVKEGWTANPRAAAASLRRLVLTYPFEAGLAVGVQTNAPTLAPNGEAAADDPTLRAQVLAALMARPDAGDEASAADHAWYGVARSLSARLGVGEKVATHLKELVGAARVACPDIAPKQISFEEQEEVRKLVDKLSFMIEKSELATFEAAVATIENRIGRWNEAQEAGYLMSFVHDYEIRRYLDLYVNGTPSNKQRVDDIISKVSEIWARHEEYDAAKIGLVARNCSDCFFMATIPYGNGLVARNLNPFSKFEFLTNCIEDIYDYAHKNNLAELSEIGQKRAMSIINWITPLGSNLKLFPGIETSICLSIIDDCLLRIDDTWMSTNSENWGNLEEIGELRAKAASNISGSLGNAYMNGLIQSTTKLETANDVIEESWARALTEKWHNLSEIASHRINASSNTANYLGPDLKRQSPETLSLILGAIERLEETWRLALRHQWKNLPLLAKQRAECASNCMRWFGKVGEDDEVKSAKIRLLDTAHLFLYHPIVGRTISEKLRDFGLLEQAQAAKPKVYVTAVTPAPKSEASSFTFDANLNRLD
jgi:hypothetical protein